MKQEQKIMYDSDQAAQLKTVTGWMSADGRFFGKDEHMARYCGCTHMLCECGNEMKKGYGKCESCRRKKEQENYLNLPLVEWDGSTPLVIYNDDKYFFDESDIADYCEINEVMPEDLRLCICEPNLFTGVDYEMWTDILPEDCDDLPKKLVEGIKVLNKLIGELPPASWSQGKKRTTIHFGD